MAPIGPNGEALPYPDQMMGGGPPADLAALLGGGGAPPAPADGTSKLREALQMIADYQAGEQDDEDLLAAEEIRTRIQKLLAKQQQEQDGLLQGKFTPAALR